MNGVHAPALARGARLRNRDSSRPSRELVWLQRDGKHLDVGCCIVFELKDGRVTDGRVTDGYTLCFGQTRKVDRQATVSVGDAIYSVPHELIGERVWVRAETEQLVVVHVDEIQGPREVARHQLTTPGRPSINEEHYPPRPAGALERKPRARSSEEREFLAIGEGAQRWLKRAAAEGTQRIRRKMAEAVDLAKLHGTEPVNDALERCASYGRFADGDLASILAHQQTATVIPLPVRAPEESSLQTSTRSWEGFGR
jgi:hypothetical protein